MSEMVFWKKPPRPTEVMDNESEIRLVTAEARANTVYEKAMLLRTMVMRRDQANHWQESVNKLFQGGSTP